MKKNRMMRLASGLLVAVLLSTCTISGTFAKYVTEASGSDEARVAKWGVQVTAQGPSNFSTKYETHDEEYSGEVSVQAEEAVVAPGTSSDDVDGDTVFTISGTPEVATRVTVDIEEDFEDVFLAKGEYTDYTVHIQNDDGEWVYGTFELKDDYYPIKWSLSISDDADAPDGVVKEGTLAEIVEYLEEDYVKDAEYAPNTDLAATFTLTWKWDFEQNDKADTWLGNAAAGLIEENLDDGVYNLGIAYEATVTVTQID